MLKPFSVLFLLLMLLAVIATASTCFAKEKDTIRVTFLSPNPPSVGFWMHYNKTMQAAANNLNIELTILHAESLDRFAYLNSLEAVNVNDTDYVVALMRHNIAQKLVEKFESSPVKLFASNVDVPEKDKKDIGLPRQRYKNWIGHTMPDDYHAGYLLAEQLIQNTNVNTMRSVVAVSGSRDSSVSFLRNLGLRDYIDNQMGTKLEQVVHTDWRYETALQKGRMLFNRYNDAKIIWCASDEIARAVLDTLSGYEGINDYHIGGIDWSVSAINSWGQSGYVTSVGGHFLEAGIVLALTRDFHDGYDFAEQLGTQMRLRMAPLSEQNLPLVRDLILNENWHKLDFSKVSQSFGGDRQLLSQDYQAVLKTVYVKNDD
ncbi:ABC transporter substrate-binding protein [Planctobacterium marinum]|uniref:Periplasmic binding protein domain-containing protein n=1 Tax=Planctobacterium marinum TaxID=1631968 RepID=A0AA48KPY2_9ALTE|nr:hypothetical protein MACH26_26770 [Planctobacterium marinum]